MTAYKRFWHWFFTDSTTIFFQTWMRVARFVPRFFSIALLTRTLLAPWHRDVTLKDWRGFDPIRSAQRFLWNVFSRLIGGIVRAAVIVIGIAMTLLVFVGGGLLFIIYFTAPGIFIVGIGLLLTSLWYVGIGLMAVVLFLVFRAHTYHTTFYHKKYSEMDIAELARQPWFHRVWKRIGVDHRKIGQHLFQDFEVFKNLLREHDMTVDECEKVIGWEMRRQMLHEERNKLFSEVQLATLRPIGLYWHFGYTVHLDAFVEDLTLGDRSDYSRETYFGHDEEMEMLELVLARPEDNNAMILGVPGVGRKMLMHELARRIRKGYYDGTPLGYMRVLRADFGAALAHASEGGADPEYVIHNLFHEAAFAGNVILFVDNFEQYMENTRGFSFVTVMEQYASQPTFRMIALTSENLFHEKVEQAQSLMRYFEVITMKELNEDQTMGVLFTHFYNHTRTVFTFQALRHIVESSTRYTNTAPLPARALDLAIGVFLDWERRGADGMITEVDVDTFVQKKTGVPVGEITADEKDHLLSLEDHFHKRVIGQNAAVKAVAEAIRRMRSGMVQPNKPAGSFLFLGPTGVGKTEMAKTVAEQYFGSEDKIVRLDMSEFQGATAVAQFIGSRQLGQKGKLTDTVQDNPYGVLLLDEIEKANPEVLDLFLQILDEGFVHDAFGKKVTFTTMIIICTSNAGALLIRDYVEQGRSMNEAKKEIIDSIVAEGSFRPEFINRFDDVVFFEPIHGEQIHKIAVLQLEKFAQQIFAQQNIGVTFDDAVADEVIKRGFDVAFGARSINRYINDAVADSLAKKLISGNIKRGEDIRFGVKDMDL